MQSDRVDAAIDQVAAAMTAGEPRSTFTSAVMNRLAGQEARPTRWRAALVLAPIAVLVITIVFVSRAGRLDHVGSATPSQGRGHEVEDPIRPPASADASPRGARNNGLPPAGRIAETTASTTPPSVIKRPTAEHDVALVPERLASPIETLTVPPIATPKLTTDPMPTDPIGSDRLTPIPLLAIAPLAVDGDQRREQ